MKSNPFEHLSAMYQPTKKCSEVLPPESLEVFQPSFRLLGCSQLLHFIHQPGTGQGDVPQKWGLWGESWGMFHALSFNVRTVVIQYENCQKLFGYIPLELQYLSRPLQAFLPSWSVQRPRRGILHHTLAQHCTHATVVLPLTLASCGSELSITVLVLHRY